MQILRWTEMGELVESQADLFRGCLPYSGSFAVSGIVTESGVQSMDCTGFPSDEGESLACSLADLLETETDWLSRNPGKSRGDWIDYLRKYCLSRAAAEGILRRAESRSRRLPELLEAVLEAVAERSSA